MASDKKKGKTLRSDVLDGRTVRYTIRFTEAENHRMLDMYERSGCHSIAKFLRFRVFG